MHREVEGITQMRKSAAPKVIIPDNVELKRRQAERDGLAERQDAKELRYDRRARAFHFAMRSGAAVTIPVAALREFDNATQGQLQEVKLVAAGSAIEHRGLDIDMSVHGIIRDVFGFGEIQQKRAGSVKTVAKAASSRANGAKGGRPRKTPA
jgi:hypothetical protein